MTDEVYQLDDLDESERLVLSDLINRVLDKGVVISADLTISIADVDLIQLDLKVLISSVATLRRRAERKHDRLSLRPGSRP
jgi:gas vesicle structural protein